MRTQRQPDRRHGTDAANDGLAGDVTMGSHLSRKVQAGRWRVRRRLPDDLVSIVGIAAQVEVLEDLGAGPLEASMRRSCDLPSGDVAGAGSGSAATRPASRRARSAAGTWPSRGGCPGMPPPRQRHPQEVVQGDDRAMPGSRRASACVDQLAVGERAGEIVGRGGESIGLSSTSIGRRRSAPDEVEAGIDGQTVEPGIEPVRVAKPGRSRQARMSASWTASRASSGSRRISRAAASSRASAGSTSAAKAS